MEKLTQEQKVAIVNTDAPGYVVFGREAFKAPLRRMGVVGPGGGLTDLGKMLRQRIMDQMLDEML